MQRTGLLALAILVVLAGCSGGIGGDGTGTPTPDRTATPTADGPPPTTMLLQDVTAPDEPVIQGQPVTVTLTVANTGQNDGRQTVSLHRANHTVANATVQLATGESAEANLTISETDSLAPGERQFLASTGNDTRRISVRIEERRTYDRFFENVSSQTVDVVDTERINNQFVSVTFEPNKGDRYTKTYLNNDDLMPAVQAAALEMARNSEAPPKVSVRLRADGQHVWRANLTTNLARQYANGSITPREFRQALSERARGPYADRAPVNLPAYLTLTTGDRARRAYARTLANRLENSTWSEHYTVTDYGLYNGTVEIPNSTRTLGPNASIFVEFQSPRKSAEVQYRNFSSTERGVAEYETVYKWGNLSREQRKEELPKSVRLRFVDQSDELYVTQDIPTRWIRTAVDENTTTTPTNILLAVDFSELSKEHNGGVIHS